MKRIFQVIIFLLIVLFTAHAQRVCSSTDYKQQLLAADPSLKDVFKTIEKQIVAANTKSAVTTALRDTTANEIIYIPVVVHVLYKNSPENISDAQVKSQFDVLNKDFRMMNADKTNTPAAFKPFAADARIQFCLAQVDPNGKKTNGIDRHYTEQAMFTTDDGMKLASQGGVAAWDSKRYLNLWVCRLNGRSLGYATPPGTAADRDGVVLAYDVFGNTGNLRAVFNKGRTATHEIGHWLGLIHLWGDATCGDDHVDDTPTQQSYNFDCPIFPKTSSCSPNANGDMFMNFMDFADDACMNMFTKGQVARMRALFAQNNIRNSFLASFACDSTLVQGGPVPSTDGVPPATTTLASTRLYPNPVHTSVTIECKAATATNLKTLAIFNSLGMRVFTSKLIQNKTILDLSHLTPGIYFVSISDGKDKFVTKIIKQ